MLGVASAGNYYRNQVITRFETLVGEVLGDFSLPPIYFRGFQRHLESASSVYPVRARRS
jgi:hypothetical protein